MKRRLSLSGWRLSFWVIWLHPTSSRLHMFNSEGTSTNPRAGLIITQWEEAIPPGQPGRAGGGNIKGGNTWTEVQSWGKDPWLGEHMESSPWRGDLGAGKSNLTTAQTWDQLPCSSVGLQDLISEKRSALNCRSICITWNGAPHLTIITD